MTQHPPSSPQRFPKKSRTVFETVLTGPRLLVSLLVLLAIVAGAYSAWWHWLADEAEKRIIFWAEGLRADGRNVTYARITQSGFPGPLLIRIDQLVIDHAPGGWTLKLPTLNAYLQPWNIMSITGTLVGPADLEIRTGPATGRYQLSATQNHYQADLGRLPSLDLRFDDAEIKSRGTDQVLRIDHLEAGLAQSTLPVYGALQIDTTDITLPTAFNSPFGPDIQSLSARIEATGAEPPTGPNARSLQAWRVNGGALDVTNVSIIHGPLGLSGVGTLALDENLQPEGAFTAKITGYNGAIDALSGINMIPPGNAAIAKIVLGALAKIPEGGGPKMIDVPLTAQDQYLSVGPVQLLRLPQIIWPGR